MKSILATLFCIILINPGVDDFSNLKYEQNSRFTKFSKSKKALYSLPSTKETFYCKCPYNKKKKVDLEACSYVTWKFTKRAQRVEAEHVVPAHTLCGKTVEWKKGHPQCFNKIRPYKGRKCAPKRNPTCIRAYNDLHNLRPANGEINAMRSNYKFGIIEGEERKFGVCNFEVKNRVAEPPNDRQGDIARIYLFMHNAYKELNLLNKKEYNKYIQWSKADPVDHAECSLNENIFKLQGTYNSVVKALCDELIKTKGENRK